tara:strand:- start:116 stop:514 length:399 start_codon:yes stop_codon:yes gene_type:complete
MGGMNNKFESFSKQPNIIPNINNNNNIQSTIMNNNRPPRQNYIAQRAPSGNRHLFNRRKQGPNSQQFTHQETPIPIQSLNPENIDDMTEKYEQLCEICNKIYHNNNQIHTMYTVVIISLFIIIMMLLKKVLK